jgi:hypothetical protein
VDPVCALDSSVVTSSREAQAEIKNAIAEKKAAKIARRFITRVKLTIIPLSLKSLRLWSKQSPKLKLSPFDVRLASR